MENKDIVNKIKTNYNHRIEAATLRVEELFGNLDENILFALSFEPCKDEDEDYFHIENKNIFIKVKNLSQVKDILIEMNAIKPKTDDCLYSLCHKGKIQNDQPFILKITIFESLR